MASAIIPIPRRQYKPPAGEALRPEGEALRPEGVPCGYAQGFGAQGGVAVFRHSASKSRLYFDKISKISGAPGRIPRKPPVHAALRGVFEPWHGAGEG